MLDLAAPVAPPPPAQPPLPVMPLVRGKAPARLIRYAIRLVEQPVGLPARCEVGA